MKHFTNAKPAEILLVEDNEGDIELTKVAFQQGKIANNLHVARDGMEGLEYLRKEGEFSDAIMPDIILLDLNMPRMNGREFLAQVKEDEALKHIPVIVMTSSKAQQDIAKSYNLHANSYILKPVSLDAFADVVNVLERFWFNIVVLPEEGEAQEAS